MAKLELKNVTKMIERGANEQLLLLDHLNLTIEDGDFVTVLGGNGAGKSTLFNTLSGSLSVSSGKIYLDEQDMTNKGEVDRAALLSRVFQDPKMGTAPRMTVVENLLLAENRGKKRSLRRRRMEERRTFYFDICKEVGNGLEEQLNTPSGNLSGGQRQALSLLMATLHEPSLLLLDEHTAALDPKTAKQLMTLTNKKVKEHHLTCLMITHRMEDALNYGNRLIVLQRGKIVKDYHASKKKDLTMHDLLSFFEPMD